MSGAARLGRALAAAAVVAAALVAVPPPAGAQVTGGCSATVAGQDANAAHNVRHAVTVSENDTIVVTGTAPGPITGYTVYLTFGPARFRVAGETVSDGRTTWTSTVNVKDYARYGVGLYRVEGDTSGTVCSGWAYVKVTGPFPLFTVAGAVGGVLMVGGAVGMVLSRPRKVVVGRQGVVT